VVIAVSEASWFTPERPAEIEAFWLNAYPGIDTIPNKVAQMQQAGYIPVASFILPEVCWTDHFYVPQEKAQELFLSKHAGNPTARLLLPVNGTKLNFTGNTRIIMVMCFILGRRYN